MPLNTKAQDSLIKFKNAVRGASDPLAAASRARQYVAPELFEKAQNWMATTPFRGQTLPSLEFPTSYAKLMPTRPSQPMSVGRELAWAAARILRCSSALVEYLELRDHLSRL